MKKLNNKSIVLSFKILSILAFSLLIVPTQVAADYGRNYTFGSFDNGSNNVPNYQPPVQYPNYYNTAYQNPAPATQVIYVREASPSVAKSTTTTKTTNADTSNTVASSNNSASTVATNSVSTTATKSLATNAIFGSNGFLPSGLIQWVLFAIIILLIVILVRRIFGYKEEYHLTPMKHE